MKPLVNIYISQSQKTASGQLELIIRREVRSQKKEKRNKRYFSYYLSARRSAKNIDNYQDIVRTNMKVVTQLARENIS